MIPRRIIRSSTYFTFSLKVRSPLFSFSSSSSDVRDDSKNIRVSVWWDFENCQIPSKTNAFDVTKIITGAVRANGIYGPVQITAFGDVLQLRRDHQVALSMTGVRINHVPKGHKNSADMSLLGDVMKWVSKNPPPAHLFFISDDCDFACTLHNLRMSNYNILLACKGISTNALTTAASVIWQWGSLLKGVDLKGKRMSNLPYAYYGDWYGKRKVSVEDPIMVEDQTPYSDDLVEEFSDAVSSSSSSSSCVRPIPVELFNQICLILKSNPEGIFLRQFKEELRRLYPDIENDYYGYRTLSNFLASMPNVLEVRLSGADYLVQTSTKLAATSRPLNECLSSLREKNQKFITDKTPTLEQNPEEKCSGESKTNDSGDLGKSKRRLRSLFSIIDLVSDREVPENVESAVPFNSLNYENEESTEPVNSHDSDEYCTKSQETISEIEDPDNLEEMEDLAYVKDISCLDKSEETVNIEEPDTSDNYVRMLMETVKSVESVGFENAPKKTKKTANSVNSEKILKKRRKSKVLTDCEKLIGEILENYPNGYNLGMFKGRFLKKYGYELDVEMLGHTKLSSVFKTMPNVVVLKELIHPNVEDPCSVADRDRDTGPDPDSVWDELGPIDDGLEVAPCAQNDSETRLQNMHLSHRDRCLSDSDPQFGNVNNDNFFSESEHKDARLKRELDQDYFFLGSEDKGLNSQHEMKNDYSLDTEGGELRPEQGMKDEYSFLDFEDEDSGSKQGMKDDYSLTESEGEVEYLSSGKGDVKKENSSLLDIIDSWHGEDESVVEQDDDLSANKYSSASAVVEEDQVVDRKGMFLVDGILRGLKTRY